MGVKFSNNAKTTLSASVSTSATSVSVASSSGFPSLSGGDYFYATMVQQSDDTALEIVKVTAVSGTTWTVSRAQDNTSATAFASGDKIELRASAGVFIDLFAEKAPIADPTFTGNLTIGSAQISETELEILDGATVTTDELNKLDGTTATATSLTYGKDLYDTGVTAAEFDYLDGVTSNIQTQISTKLTTPSGFARGSVIIGDSSGNPANLSAGANGYVLKSDGTDVTWAEDEKTTTTNFVKNAFTGDNTTTAFTLSQSPNSEDNLIVFIEGVFQNQGDYALSGTTLTFDEAPATGRKIVAYHVKAAVSGANLNHDQFTASGSAAFTLSITPINENNTQVFIDGVYQQKTDYSVSGTTLTFDTAPASGAIVEVMTFTQTEINVPTTGSVVTASIANDVNLNGNPTTTTQSAGNNTTRIATTAFVETAVSNLIDSAPGTMNTLNEIAAALGDDPSFTTTVNNAIATKLPLAGGTMTGNLVVGGSGFTTTTINSTRTSGNIGGINFSASGTNKAQIYGTVDGQLKLGTGGDGTVDSNLALTIDAAGKVGIGTTSPLDALHVTSAVSTDYRGNLLLSDSTAIAAGVGGQLNFGGKYTGSTYTEWAGIQGAKENATDGQYGGQLEFKTRAHNGALSTKMTLDSSGKVGIGTSSPSSYYSDNLVVSAPSEGGITLASTNTTNGNYLAFADGTSGNAAYRGLVGYNHNVDSLLFYSAGSERMRIASDGKVGIGTASPNRTLTVYGSSNGEMNLKNSSADFLIQQAGHNTSIGNSSSSGYINFFTNNGNANVRMLANGKVGIGETDPTAYYADNLVVKAPSEGGITIGASANSHMNYLMFAESATSGAGGYRGYIGYAHNATTASGRLAISSQGYTQFITGSSERMRIDTNGKVGINKTDPSAYLDVHAPSGVASPTVAIFKSDQHGLQLAVDITSTATYVQSNHASYPLVFNAVTGGNVGVGTASPTEKFTVNGLFTGGFGASTTGGTADYNHLTNARAGMGHTLLLGNATNGHGGSGYYHVLNFEYAGKLGAANMTQMAIGYNVMGIYLRYRYSGSWSSWTQI